MNTLSRSPECSVVQALEARIWLDRREDACAFYPPEAGTLARLRSWFRNFSARTQLGPARDSESGPDLDEVYRRYM